MKLSSMAIALIVIIILPLLRSINHTLHKRKTLPPGPWPLPILGNLHMLGSLPHRSLAKLAQKYGPIMYMQLGVVPTIVVSSAKAAELILKKHDAVSASRPPLQAAKYIWYGGNKAIGFTPHGDYWRRMRKLCASQLMSAAKVEEFGRLRREEIAATVRRLNGAAAVKEVVDLGDVVGQLVEDIMFKMVVGKSSKLGDDRGDD